MNEFKIVGLKVITKHKEDYNEYKYIFTYEYEINTFTSVSLKDVFEEFKKND